MKALSKIWVALSVASMLTLTACGIGGGGNQGGGNTITVGVETPTTGSSAKMGQDMNHAIQMAVDEINNKGGVLGKKITLTFADDAADPQTAAAAANKLVSQGVVAVVGGYASGAVLPASGVYHQAGIPMVVTAANSAKIPAQGYNNIFLVNGTTTAQAQTAADYMVHKLKGKRIAILNDNSAYSVDLANQTKQFVEQMGGQVVAFDAVNPQETDFTTELTKLKSLKPDATYWTAYYAAGGLLLKQFKQVGVPGAFGVGDGANDPTIIKIAGKQNAEDMFTTTSPTPQFIPSAKDWVQQYQSRFGEAPGPYSALSYDGMRVLADAISRAGSTDKDAIIKALAATKDFQTFGGPVSFKPDGELATSNFIVLVVKNGEYTRAQ
jgi:ABC-type branched-subunit amino acid transport system substrate-binding protein